MRIIYILISFYMIIGSIYANEELNAYKTALEGKSGIERTKLLETLSQSGNKYARYEIAKKVAETKGKEVLAARMFKHLYENGLPEAGWDWYAIYNKEDSPIHNKRMAMEIILNLSKDESNIEAQELVGVRYGVGLGTEKNLKKAKQYLKKAINAKSYRFGTLYANICIITEEYEEALPVLKNRMWAGDLDAIFLLSLLYRDGTGIEKDRVTALALFTMFYMKIKDKDKYKDTKFTVEKEIQDLQSIMSDSERNEAISLSVKLSTKIFPDSDIKDRLESLK